MKRGTVVGINDDPSWAQVSEFAADHVASHWGELLTIDLPGDVEKGGVSPSVCVERSDRVTADQQHMVVGGYTFTLDLQAAVCRLGGPEDLEALAVAFQSAANQLRDFKAAEGVGTNNAEAPDPSNSSSAAEVVSGADS